MNAHTAATAYIAGQNAAAPIAVTTWCNKALTRREQRSIPAWEIINELEAMVEDGTARKVESVMGATAYVATEVL